MNLSAASNNNQATNPSERYRIVSLIGKGAYASVYRAYDELDQKDVAIKIISLHDCDDDIELIHREILIQSDLNLKQLTTYYSSYVIGYQLWIVMEILEAGSLAEFIQCNGPLDEGSIAYVMHELMLVSFSISQITMNSL
jgi:serine/threonine-protein kinase 24/25/MST4